MTHPLLIMSFRYAQLIDEESVSELAIYAESLRESGVRLVMTGLHKKVIDKMEASPYLSGMMHEERTMYAISVPPESE